MVAAPIRTELRHKGTGREFRDLRDAPLDLQA